MAAVEHNPAAQERIPHTRSTRLADQAATAALYVTHPERSILMREPTKPEPTSSSRPGLSNASAAAALIAHRKRDLGGKEPATHVADQQKATSPSYGGYPYQAAMYAVREGRHIAGTHGTRRRADSAPSEAARASVAAKIDNPSDPFDDLDKYMNASRIQNAHMNRKMFTATPPVAPELEDHRRRSILEAASMSMAKDMYATIQSKEAGSAGPQRLPARARSQRSPSTQDAATLQQASTMMLHQALNLQDVAQKRAAEKLAQLEDETAGYRNYYGIERQPTRSSFVLRRRRGSNETEQYDAERSKEIRTQMTALRSKLDAVDEKREKDRASLLELARKNVDATMQDIEKRMYTEGGRTVAMQKYLDEKAQERAQKGIQEMDTQYMADGRVNISAQKYVEMADVEDLARHRLQPTFDEIEELAQSQKAREVEARLDEEQRQHLLALEREREADIEMEQRHHLEQLKQEQKAKEEKVWPWKRKSRHIQDFEPPKETTEDQTQRRVNGAAAGAAGAVTAAASQGTQTEDQTAASGAGQAEPVSRRDSKFKSWFKERMGHRSSTSLPKGAAVGTQEGEQRESEPAGQDAPRAPSTGGEEYTDTHEMDTEQTKPEGEDEREREQRSRSSVSGVAHAPEGDSRQAPLRSNPVTARDLNQPTENGLSGAGDTSNKLDGMTPSEYLNTQRDSQEIVEKASSLKDQRRNEAEGHVHELAAPSIDRESLRDTAAEQSLEAPPAIGDAVGKRTSNGTVRESRFSEDL